MPTYLLQSGCKGKLTRPLSILSTVIVLPASSLVLSLFSIPGGGPVSFSKDFCSSSMSSVAFVSVKKKNEITRLHGDLSYHRYMYL